jgi:hypothetical protein
MRLRLAILVEVALARLEGIVPGFIGGLKSWSFLKRARNSTSAGACQLDTSDSHRSN